MASNYEKVEWEETFDFEFYPNYVRKATLHKGPRYATRTTSPYYKEDGHFSSVVAASASVPESVSLWYPVIVGPDVRVPPQAILRGPDITIKHSAQIVVISYLGSQYYPLTAIYTEDEIWINTRCFCGPIGEFIDETREKKKANDPHRHIYEVTCLFLESIALDRRRKAGLIY